MTPDATLFAAFAAPSERRPPGVVVVVGTGPDSAWLALAARAASARIALVESDPARSAAAHARVVAEGLTVRVQVLATDLGGAERALGRGTCDLVLASGPSLAADAIAPLLAAARQLLARRGRIALAFPADALAWLFADLGRVGLFAKRIRMIHPENGAFASAVWVEALAGRPGGTVVEPPWLGGGEPPG